MSDVRILVVGCGSIGRRHVRLLRERRDVSVAACDTSAAAARQIKRIGREVRVFTSLGAALARGPEIVVVATPNETHCDVTLKAFEAGAHVLCEKPLADTPRRGRKMVAAAAKHGRVLAVGYCLRFRPSLQHIAKMVRRGELGNLVGGRAMVGTYKTLLCARSDSRSMYGALILDYTHELDYLRLLFGEVTRVTCFANDLGDKKRKASPSVAVIVLGHESGALVSVHMDYVQHPQRRILEVYGDRKTVELDFQAGLMRVFDCKKPGYQTLKFPTAVDDMFRAEHQDMLDAVRKGRPPCVDGEAGLRVLETADEAIRQIRRGRGAASR
jgi:predicted dehydrogenase